MWTHLLSVTTFKYFCCVLRADCWILRYFLSIFCVARYFSESACLKKIGSKWIRICEYLMDRKFVNRSGGKGKAEPKAKPNNSILNYFSRNWLWYEISYTKNLEFSTALWIVPKTTSLNLNVIPCLLYMKYRSVCQCDIMSKIVPF